MSAVDTLKKPGDWEIRIETQEDAIRFSRIGGYAGFTYVAVSIVITLLIMLLATKQIGELPNIIMYTIIALVFIRFAIFWLLSWRTHTGKGAFTAPLLFGLFLAEQAFIVYSVMSAGQFAGILIPIILGVVIGYPIYAGVRGNWANRKYRRAAKFA